MSYNFPVRLSKISTQTASSSASLSFTSCITSAFSTYYIKIRDLVPVTDNTILLMTFSVDNGANYLATNYKWGQIWSNSSPSGGINSSASDSSIRILDAISNSSTNPTNGDIMCYNFNQAVFVPKVNLYVQNYRNQQDLYFGGGMNTSTTGVNAVKFAMNSGNISSGTITLYGVESGGFLY